MIRQRFIRCNTTRRRKTVNKVLTVLNTLLTKAVEWGVIPVLDHAGCKHLRGKYGEAWRSEMTSAPFPSGAAAKVNM